MKKKDIKILAVVAVILMIALVVIYLFTSYRGPDGLTFKEARMIEKYGAAEISKEELENSIDLDKYNDTVAFYESDPTFGDRIKHFFGADNNNDASGNNSSPASNGGNNSKDENKNSGDNSGNTTKPTTPSNEMTYEKYIAMSPEKQQAYFENYSNPEDFFNWYNKAKAKYDKENEKNVVEGGNIDLGDYID